MALARSRSARRDPCCGSWPTGTNWTDQTDNRHPPDAVLKRAQQIIEQGAGGVYFFNFCCFCKDGQLFQAHDQEIFKNLGVKK